jgi:hypothetical protein
MKSVHLLVKFDHIRNSTVVKFVRVRKSAHYLYGYSTHLITTNIAVFNESPLFSQCAWLTLRSPSSFGNKKKPLATNSARMKSVHLLVKFDHIRNSTVVKFVRVRKSAHYLYGYSTHLITTNIAVFNESPLFSQCAWLASYRQLFYLGHSLLHNLNSSCLNLPCQAFFTLFIASS